MHPIIDAALRRDRLILSDFESKQVLADYGIPVTREVLARTGEELEEALGRVGLPAALKGCTPELAHKTENGLVRLDVRSPEEARRHFRDLLDALPREGAGVLVQEFVRGERELVAGLIRDPQFGPCVMFGLGGIFAEILEDVVFRVAPLEMEDALEMMAEIRGRGILGPVRGMKVADREALARVLVRLGDLGLENEAVVSLDVNPLILSGGRPLAVDALIQLAGDA